VVELVVAETAKRERERKNCRNEGQRGWFLADFGLDFLLSQTLKSTSIYRQIRPRII
jgi:hypothetical protein